MKSLRTMRQLGVWAASVGIGVAPGGCVDRTSAASEVPVEPIAVTPVSETNTAVPPVDSSLTSAQPIVSSSDEAKPAPTGLVWVGIYCRAPDTQTRRLVIAIDDAPPTTLDVRCTAGERSVDQPPSAQLSMRARRGVRTLRVLDDEGGIARSVAEVEVAVYGETWIEVSHHVIGGGSFMTTVEPGYERPTHSVVDL